MELTKMNKALIAAVCLFVCGWECPGLLAGGGAGFFFFGFVGHRLRGLVDGVVEDKG